MRGAEVKCEPMDVQQSELEEAEEEAPHFWPAALGLRPVGAASPPRPVRPLQALNARGMPARIRKKNKLFFDDNIVNAPPPRASPKRGPKTTPVKTPSKLLQSPPPKKMKSPRVVQEIKEKPEPSSPPRSTSPDRKTGQRIGMRLRNLLKLPKAHKWVCFEHFYSNIDKTLLAGENDFRICLRESFPKLTDRNLTQVQWTKIRRIMGKPRRCSQAFFNEERRDLEMKRQKIRFIQQRKIGNISWKDLPNEIPMQLVIGSKVTARLRKPQDGLFTGTIEGVDTSNNTYRITFERTGLGTHSVPDFEVLSQDQPDTINLSATSKKIRPRLPVQGFMSLYQNVKSFSPPNDRSYYDPLLGQPQMKYSEDAIVGSYSIKFLESIVKITNILEAKKVKITKLQEFNSLAEKRKSFGEKMPDDFERRYAGVVIELERMNLDLQKYLNEVQSFCYEIAPGLSMAAMLAPSRLREKCRDEATTIVNKHNVRAIQNEKVLNLITDLMALLLQTKSISDSDQNAYELKVLEGTMQQIKVKLDPVEQQIFQNVEIHMQQLQNSIRSS
ncbi:myb-interacting protein 130 [Arctopsyche grandis]|uniref:myb-interacting protein 130 n=1 Tax=Arctopsyche grandis TaxID=121162 RepID=UPI00406D6663